MGAAPKPESEPHEDRFQTPEEMLGARLRKLRAADEVEEEPKKKKRGEP